MGQILNKKSVMIIAGEASGDIHGSRLVTAMHKRNSDLFFYGIGGRALRDVGVKILVDAEELSVIGITEVFSKLRDILKGIRIAKRSLKRMRPDLLILIDFPDFNLHVAATAKKLKIPVLYYISPQVWAWRPGRVSKIGKLVDHMAVILPFEQQFYRKHNVPVTFVGHPLLDNKHATDNICGNITTGASVIGLLPGSRDGEIARHLPVMLKAAGLIAKRAGKVKFIISIAPSIEREHIEDIVKNYKQKIDFDIIADSVDKVFRKCRLVVAASGTVTLEAAISGTPMLIIYKVSPISYWLGKIMIRIKNIGLVNLIAGREIVPELVQSKASPENIADTVLNMLNDASGLERLRKELLSVKDSLGGPGASERVAEIALGML
ncbi:MAG TPA: lipid-A-disaccharide synthase [Anaerolineae bacterium]|nr:lipid-A-disaccharide synthase [Anaerolineae bacterium]